MSRPQRGPRRERQRPVELVLMAFVVGIFIGLVVLLGSRSPTVSVIFAGISFIVTLLVLAMLTLVASGGPDRGDGPVLYPPKDEPPKE